MMMCSYRYSEPEPIIICSVSTDIPLLRARYCLIASLNSAHPLLGDFSSSRSPCSVRTRRIVLLKTEPFGEADVIVCDGFVGNTVLKLSEGMAKTMVDIIKEEITKGAYKFAAAMLKKPFRNVKNFLDSDEVGGAPFIGLKSLVVKAHGSSNAKAIKNAVRQCVVFTEADIIGKIKDKL